MTVGELREILCPLPNDAEVQIHDGDCTVDVGEVVLVRFYDAGAERIVLFGKSTIIYSGDL